jgi:hypothetical protein
MNREYKEWTDAEIAILKAADGQLTATELAAKLTGRNRADIHMYCDANDIPFRRQWRRRTWASEPEALAIVKAGKEAGRTSEQVAVDLAEAGYARSAGAVRRIWNTL